jgi:hypothetical protein
LDDGGIVVTISAGAKFSFPKSIAWFWTSKTSYLMRISAFHPLKKQPEHESNPSPPSCAEISMGGNIIQYHIPLTGKIVPSL